jgi:flagellar hook protein FlgE
MLRSLYSGISGLRSHQTMLDVTGNNIANVNTAGFKGSSVQFQDTLSQLAQGAGGPQADIGGTNPAQVGLGVQVAGISTNFAQGSAQSTGRATDLMIQGDGFFVTKLGGETLYTRAGAFDFDPQGRLVDPSGALVQGWGAVNGQILDGGAVGTVTLPLGAISTAVATTSATMGGNLPDDATVGTELVRDLSVFDATGDAQNLSLTFTRTATGWDVSDGAVPAAVAGTITFANGALTSAPTITVAGGAVTLDVSKLTGFAALSTAAISGQDGRKAGTLESFTMSKDGTLVGSFSNGASESVGRVSLATFVNPGGLEKAGSSSYRATFNSGTAELGTPGGAGFGSIVSGALEMSNVDLSQEFTNLIVAQRGFQANARIITTSDEVLQELTNLKR